MVRVGKINGQGGQKPQFNKMNLKEHYAALCFYLLLYLPGNAGMQSYTSAITVPFLLLRIMPRIMHTLKKWGSKCKSRPRMAQACSQG